MRLDEPKAGLALVGLEPDRVCTVVAVVPHAANAVPVIYRLPEGGIKERLLVTADEATITAATVERPWAFDGDAAAFQLACEAKRIDLAFLFDPMMAVHTSNVDPLPHQITAVYESMLPRQPLRYVLADDPGAGKTIMAGLYIRELIMPADSRRILIVAPGSLVEQATAAKSLIELEGEIRTLEDLEEQAKALVASGQDLKWEELSKLLQNTPEMHDVSGRQRKIIIFSEHRDTRNYLQARIAGLLGTPEAIVTIHGGTHRDQRKKAQALFRSEPDVRVLIATDAAGEGVNLQCVHLMVNYDLPWNPNRLEQRFGRIHRINQTEVCHLWSLVAKETREGTVWHRLLEKLAVECEALKGKVFNILGDVFEEKSLKDLRIEAIRYGDRPAIKAKLTQRIDHVFDHGHFEEVPKRNALAQETMAPERLFNVKEEMAKAEARRLQPLFGRSFFQKAFDTLGGTLHRREAKRWEVTHVPAAIRERDRQITGRNRRDSEPVLKRYERICFTREAMRQAQNGTTIVLGGALVVPAGLIQERRGEGKAVATADAAARKKVELLAMDAVTAYEQKQGNRVVDVSAAKRGWDLTSYPPPIGDRQPDPKHIEVKGRVAGADMLTITRNELIYAVNQGDKFVLAIVLVHPDDRVEGPDFVANPFQREPDWGAASVNYDLRHLLRDASMTTTISGRFTRKLGQALIFCNLERPLRS